MSQNAELSVFIRDFERLRPGYEAILQQAREIGQDQAPQFNIFNILGAKVARDEVATHSAFLAVLFNPDGTHGQAHLFLETFLAYCQRQEKFPRLEGSIREDTWIIQTEHATTVQRTQTNIRLDIVIRCPISGYLIVLENKVAAGERSGQLDDYADWLKEQVDDFPNQALIYLTPEGVASSASRTRQYFHLSYQEDIAGWLESTLKEIQAPVVRETVRQYQRLISSLWRTTMHLDDPRLRFLAQPENLALAIDISKQLEPLKVVFREQFWAALAAELRERLAASEYANRWQVTDYIAGVDWQDYTGVNIEPLPSNQQIYLFPRFQDESPKFNYRLSFGISWSKENSYATETVRDLKKQLKQEGYKNNSWWPGNKFLNIWLGQEDFLLRMANDGGCFINEMVDKVWHLFVQYESILSAANVELAEI